MKSKQGGFGGRSSRKSDGSLVLIMVCTIAFVAFGGTAIYLLGQDSVPGMNQSRVVVKEEKPQELRSVEVLIPIKNIEAGEELKPQLFRVENRPQISVDARTVGSQEQLVGQYARSMIIAGRPLSLDYLTSIKPVSPISSEIKPGYRAVTIPVDAKSSVEGWAKAGSRVDVFWISNLGGKSQASLSLIVQNAKVLSTDRAVSNQPNNPEKPIPAHVTLLVTAQDAQKIQLAKTTGSVSLALRGDDDKGEATQGGTITLNQLYNQRRTTTRTSIPKFKGTVVANGKKFHVGYNGELIPSGF